MYLPAMLLLPIVILIRKVTEKVAEMLLVVTLVSEHRNDFSAFHVDSLGLEGAALPEVVARETFFLRLDDPALPEGFVRDTFLLRLDGVALAPVRLSHGKWKVQLFQEGEYLPLAEAVGGFWEALAAVFDFLARVPDSPVIFWLPSGPYFMSISN
ncbi:unnamed protein product [Caenorhabditis brenneri]